MSTTAIEVHTEFLLSSFTRSLRARNLSERTVDTCIESLRQFAGFLVKQGMPTQLENLSREHVESFIEYLLRKWKPEPLPRITGLLRLARGRRGGKGISNGPDEAPAYPGITAGHP